MINIKQIFALSAICLSVPLQLHAKLISINEKATQSGGYVVIQATPGSHIKFIDTQYNVDPKGYVAIGFHRELSGEQEISIISQTGTVETQVIHIAPREYNIQRVEGVPASRVTPPIELTKRIQAESAQVTKARSVSGDFDFWRVEEFIWPIQGRISGVYGSQRFYNGIPGSPHWGIDLAAVKGSPVYAPASGQIVLAEPDLYYSGGTIILDHGGSVSSTFLHLSSLDVEVGQMVKKGELIGKVGSTGRSTGPHLDWRMNMHGVRIDAALWIDDSE